MKNLMNIVLGLVLIILILPLILVYVNTHPPRYPLNISPSEYHVPYEPVSFKSEDGIDLKGWLVKPGVHSRQKFPAIIICHGVGANKSDFTELAASLSRRGYHVLLFDFRGHGDSSGRRTSLGYHEQKDVAAAFRFLKARPEIDQKHIGIYGFSMGGATAILTAAKTGEFAAVAADSSFARLKDMARSTITGFYRLPAFPFLHLSILGYDLYFQTDVNKISPESLIGDLSPVPVFIIAGDGDALIPVENGRKLFAAAKEPKQLWIIPNAFHGSTMAVAGDEYERRIGEFFDKHLKSIQK